MPPKRNTRPHGTGSIIEKHGAWYGRWRIGDQQVTRKVGPMREPGSREGLTQAQANKRLAQMMIDAGSEPPPVGERLTLEEAGRRLVLHLERIGKKKNTTISYESHLRVHLVPFFARDLADITEADVESYINAKLDAGRAPKSIVNDVTVLSRVFSFAKKKKWVSLNSCADVDRPTDPSKVDEIRYLRPEELEALLRATADLHRHTPQTRARIARMHELRSEGLSWKQVAAELGVAEGTVHYYRGRHPEELDVERQRMAALDHALYLTAALTGLRQGELIALAWEHVDWPNRRLRVVRNWTQGQYGTPKGGKSRFVPIPDRVAQVLASLWQQSAYQADAALAFGHPETGNPLDASKLLKRYKTSLGRAGLADRPFHDLRHTYGTRMAGGGVDLVRLQAWMGHADIKTTMRYAAYMPGDDDAALAERALTDHKTDHKLSETEQNSEPPNPINTGDLL